MSVVESTRAATRWATRLIPCILLGCMGLATYVVVKCICVDYYLGSKPNAYRPGTAIAFLVLHLLFLMLMLLSYARTIELVIWNPDVVPVGPHAPEIREQASKRRQRSDRALDVESQRCGSAIPNVNPDSPDLELFYCKDVFVCDIRGRPKWCGSCWNWKPDRTYHNREINRCVKKLDHFCPWVGGPVSLSSFKFFMQFNFYTACHCTVTLTAAAMTLHHQIGGGESLDGLIVTVLVLSAWFGLFTFSMTITSSRFILGNFTNVEEIKRSSNALQLAIRVPHHTPPSLDYGLVTYPLPKLDGNPSSRRASGLNLTAGASFSREALATRRFAIVRADPGMNPWSLGTYRNWKTTMGNNVFEWLLPLRGSPCAIREKERNESFYEMGPYFWQLRARHNLPAFGDDRSGEKRDGMA